MIRRHAWLAGAVVVVTVALMTGACSGDDEKNIEGVYNHPEEGAVIVKEDGVAVFSTEPGAKDDDVEGTYEVDGDTVTFEVNGKTVKATIGDQKLVFEAGAFSGDEPETFTRELDR